MKTYDNITFYNYSNTFEFESDYDHQKTKRWMQNNWTLGFYIVIIYIVFIFGVQYLMKNRPRFELRGTLCLWNALLAIFSIIGAYRMVPDLVHILTQHGLYPTVCSTASIEQKACAFWTHMFVFSKIPELGDTVFIVLRKQPLIFLHWYHHVTVLLYTWYSMAEYSSTARWFINMNYCVHAIMYSYFSLRAWGFKLPKQVAMVVTSLQLLQMVLGSGIILWAYHLLQNGVECEVSSLNVKLSLTLYFSYFVLFGRLFYKAYLSTHNKKKAAPTTTKHTSEKSKLL